MLKTVLPEDVVKEISSAWIFEKFLNLSEPLTGQSVKIRSIFNVNERTPSMFIYFDNNFNEYVFKDFSSGNFGNGVKLVQYLTGKSYSEACELIIKEYYNNKTYTCSNTPVKLENIKKYRVKSFGTRKMLQDDLNFWFQFNITYNLLSKYNVIPLSYYILSNGNTEIKIQSDKIYGYLKKDGRLYKIYQPCNKNKKFIKVDSYIQGSEQLCYNTPTLIITKSLKDIMAFHSLKFNNIELIAIDSETSILPAHIIGFYKNMYQNIILLFDNDNAGKKALEKYKERYNLNGVTPELSKDVSDCIKEHGVEKTKESLTKILNL